MKKNKLFFLLASALVFSSCVKNLEDEGVVPNFIPHFSYGGYTYYIHPSLGYMEWEDAVRACRNHDGYGYHDWFLPSQGEIDAAHSAGFSWVKGWSSSESSSDGSEHYARYSDQWYSQYNTYQLAVIPMRKQ